MKKFINIAISLGLLLSLGGCSSVRSNNEMQIEKLFEISEFSEEIIKNEWLSRLKYLEEQALNPREFPEITKNCRKSEFITENTAKKLKNSSMRSKEQ